MAINQTLPTARKHSAMLARLANARKAPRQRMVSAFQTDCVSYGKDPQIKALWAARNATFKLGEPVDNLTTMLKVRLAELKGKAPF